MKLYLSDDTADERMKLSMASVTALMKGKEEGKVPNNVKVSVANDNLSYSNSN